MGETNKLMKAITTAVLFCTGSLFTNLVAAKE